MDLAERQRRMEETLRTLNLLGAALVLGLATVTGVVFFLGRQRGPGPPPVADPTLAWVLVTLGFALLILAPFATRALLGRDPDPGPEGFEEGGKEGGTRVEALLRRFLSANLVGFALREAGGLMGAITAFLTRESNAGYALAGAAIFMFFRAWPRRSILESLAGPGA